MTLLAFGLLLFAGLHLVKSLAPGMRNALLERLGENAYKGIFSLLVLAALALIVFGWRAATRQPRPTLPRCEALNPMPMKPSTGNQSRSARPLPNHPTRKASSRVK